MSAVIAGLVLVAVVAVLVAVSVGGWRMARSTWWCCPTCGAQRLDVVDDVSRPLGRCPACGSAHVPRVVSGRATPRR